MVQLAYHANMSIRSFERRFLASSWHLLRKLFCYITRFNHALALKIQITLNMIGPLSHMDCGYFDQIHLDQSILKNLPAFTPSRFSKTNSIKPK